MIKAKEARWLPWLLLDLLLSRVACLLADTKFFLGDDCAVAVDVFAHEVVKHTATLTYEFLQSAFGGIIFVV